MLRRIPDSKVDVFALDGMTLPVATYGRRGRQPMVAVDSHTLQTATLTASHEYNRGGDYATHVGAERERPTQTTSTEDMVVVTNCNSQFVTEKRTVCTRLHRIDDAAH